MRDLPGHMLVSIATPFLWNKRVALKEKLLNELSETEGVGDDIWLLSEEVTGPRGTLREGGT